MIFTIALTLNHVNVSNLGQVLLMSRNYKNYNEFWTPKYIFYNE